MNKIMGYFNWQFIFANQKPLIPVDIMLAKNTEASATPNRTVLVFFEVKSETYAKLAVRIAGESPNSPAMADPTMNMYKLRSNNIMHIDTAPFKICPMATYTITMRLPKRSDSGPRISVAMIDRILFETEQYRVKELASSSTSLYVPLLPV